MDGKFLIAKGYAYFIAACLAGAFINAGAQKDQTKNQRIFSYIGAALAAFFIAPIVARFFNLTDESGLALCGFGVAAVWQSIYNKAVSTINGLNIPFFSGKQQ